MYTVPITEKEDVAKLEEAYALDKKEGPGYICQYMDVGGKGMVVNMASPQTEPIRTLVAFPDGLKGVLMQAVRHRFPRMEVVAQPIKAGSQPPGPDSKWLPATGGLKQSYLGALRLLAKAAGPANGNGSAVNHEARTMYERAAMAAEQGALDKITDNQLLRMREFGERAAAKAEERGDDKESAVYKELADACHAIIKEHLIDG
ncbi:MAG: hypothetical protein ISN26_06230 [Betaproteobacteria bacterium AqS2]|uniref:Uncharacterized protein n=1 Tax=Candidatus Amphirhobacter heronislandensis TaxID=1732024 RepID=A0A930XYF1_9GAMM|nr:hypothetical protein [Betaproteobacteria bacterium AqS2]